MERVCWLMQNLHIIWYKHKKIMIKKFIKNKTQV